jgi:cytochrome c oxidase subunit IV
MSSPATSHGHGHDDAHDDGAVHAHVSSAPFYALIFFALLALTITTVGQSYFDFGRMSIVIVILIASMKASLVVSFFMHLKYDNRFNALIFISSLLFIGVFFAYTMNDTDKRGDLDSEQNVRVLPTTGEEAPGQYDPAAHVSEHGASSAEPGEGKPAPAPEHH